MARLPILLGTAEDRAAVIGKPALPFWAQASSASLKDERGNEAGGPSARGSHRLGSILTCERAWFMKFVQGWRLKSEYQPTFLTEGTLIHRVLAEYWASKLVIKPRWFGLRPLAETLHQIGIGTPVLVNKALDVGREYMKKHDAIEPGQSGYFGRPIAVEEEFSATVGEIDPGGPDASLDDEVVTCRPDVIFETMPWLGDESPVFVHDHKSMLVRGGDALHRFNPEGEYAISWQAMLYLHIVRIRMKKRDVAGFFIDRVTREAPFLSDSNLLEIPGLGYEETRRQIRAAVAAEVALGTRVAQGGKPNTAFGDSTCTTRWGQCELRPFCKATDLAARKWVLENCYFLPGRRIDPETGLVTFATT